MRPRNVNDIGYDVGVARFSNEVVVAFCYNCGPSGSSALIVWLSWSYALIVWLSWSYALIVIHRH